MNDVVLIPAALEGRFRRMRRLLWSTAGCFGLSGLYIGRICPSWVRHTDLMMPMRDLPAAMEGLKIVHVSDLHASPIVLERYLNECVALVNAQHPDFVVITGDFVTGGTRYAQQAARVCGRMNARYGRVACLGNHDYGRCHPKGHGHMRQLAGYLSRRLFEHGVHVLRNEHAVFRVEGEPIQFVGVEDLWTGLCDPESAMASAEVDVPTIGLSHNPDLAPKLWEMGVEWVLAGHTHGSRMVATFPASLLPSDNPDYVGGYYSNGQGHLYITRGLGYARRTNLNRRPEITTFTLTRAEDHPLRPFRRHELVPAEANA